jgi:hypothetical protein
MGRNLHGVRHLFWNVFPETGRRRPCKALSDSSVAHAHCLPFLPNLGGNYPRSWRARVEARPIKMVGTAGPPSLPKLSQKWLLAEASQPATNRTLIGRFIVGHAHCLSFLPNLGRNYPRSQRPAVEAGWIKRLEQRANHLFCNLAQKRLLVHRDEAIARRPIHWVAKCS